MANTYDAEAAAPPDAEPDAQDAAEPGEGEGESKSTKAEVNYRAGSPVKNCGLCGYFQSKQHECDVVDEAGDPTPGEISPFGYCDTYQRQDNPFGQQLGPREVAIAHEMMQSPPDQSPYAQQQGPSAQIGNRTYR